MNCQDVETWLLDEARDGADVAAEARAHLADCPACAARLRAERQLTGALRAVAAHDAEAIAPARVEAALVAAFRAQAAQAAPAPVVSSAPAAASPIAFTQRRTLAAFTARRALAALAVAAALVLLLVAALRLQTAPHGAPAAPQQANANVATPQQVNPGTPAPQQANANVTAPTSAPAAVGNDAARPVRAASDRAQAATLAQVQGRGAAARARRLVASSTRAPAPVELGAMVVRASAVEPERVTDFVPLVAGSAAPLVSGQLVRVELPRSALAPLGLPLDPARAGDTIKADVLVGDDGLARAIRFVR
ncbi:MAG TPA: hypothetical protein VF546_21360 [Pyrinomonadaceae bacterium]|jgi:hypothetical protein